jgi:RNA polymerase primary sigma factor
MKDYIHPFPTPPASAESEVDPEQAIQQVLAALTPQEGQPITYEQIEGALVAAGIDPYSQGEIYEAILDQLDHQGVLVVDSIPKTDATEDQEVASLVDSDEVQQRLSSILSNATEHKVLLTAEEERRLLEICADGQRARQELDHAISDFHQHQIQRRIDMGKQAHDELIQRNLRLVAANVLKYGKHARHLAFEDLLQEGSIGLSHAIERFDLDLNMRLSTYATWWIRQAITRALADQDRTIRLPVHMVEKILRLYRIEQELEMTLRRAPTEAELALEIELFSPNDCQAIRHCWKTHRPLPEELAERLNKAILHIQKLRQIATSEPVSIDLPVNGDESSTLSDFIRASQEDETESKVYQAFLIRAVVQLLEQLPDRLRWVLSKRFGLEDGRSQTLEEIGKQLNLTRERVRQIEAKALRILKHPLHSRGLKAYLE